MKGVPKILCIYLILLVFTAFLGCKKDTEPKEDKAADRPVAKAQQKIATPTLAPPPAGTALPPEKAPAPEEAPVPLATLEKPEEGPKPQAEVAQVRAMAAPAVAPAARPAPGEVPEVAYEPKLVAAQTNVDIILDASGSMRAPFAATARSKFDTVRDALYDAVYEMGEELSDFPRNVAIRTFGARHPASDNNCEDSEALVKMGTPDLGGIRRMLDGMAAQGTSPIALAIKQATGDFPGGAADRVIVLIADGADNCRGDPCAAADQMQRGPNKTIINVVGFDISPADRDQLSCIAKKGGGQFFLARNENELRATLDEAINSTTPYNLKLAAKAGATPLPFSVTVYKAGKSEVVRHDKSYGTKLIRLEPGSFDILVEYAESPEGRKPSKMLKGVEILATTKVEQSINFDLGEITLSAVDNDGKLVPARFAITEAKTAQPIAEVESGYDANSFFMTPGTYDITADLVEERVEDFVLSEKDVEIKAGEAIDKPFLFQKGTLALRGMTTQKVAIPFLFQAFKAARPDMLIASGAFPATGGSVQLAPGVYDLLVVGEDPGMAASPRTRISGVKIEAAQTTELDAKFEMGELILAAVDGQGNKLPAEFLIRDRATQLDMARVGSEGAKPVSIPLPPASYDIVAYSLKSDLEPKPSVPVSDIRVEVAKPTEKEIKFVLGTLRLRGRNVKEHPMRTKFSIYRAASDELVSEAPPTDEWIVFDLAPGTYDALATNLSSTEEPKPMIWLRDIGVEDGKSVSHEAIFTAGKLKIISRGPNNEIITCKFKVYKYGADRELISGVTSDDWEIFEIEPGHYYLEVSYHDDAQAVLLKKWVNISIGENEVVEQVLRF